MSFIVLTTCITNRDHQYKLFKKLNVSPGTLFGNSVSRFKLSIEKFDSEDFASAFNEFLCFSMSAYILYRPTIACILYHVR